MMSDDDEVGLPQKGLNMIIKDILPDTRIANETRELLNQCCVEFIKHISKEAQRISSVDQRKTIYHDHVQKALKNLGFPFDYVEAANSVLGECKIAAEKRLKRKNSRLDKCGIPEEQLYLMQQQLIEKARQDVATQQQMQFQQQLQQDSFAIPSTAGRIPITTNDGVIFDGQLVPTTSNATKTPTSNLLNNHEAGIVATLTQAFIQPTDQEDYDA